MCFLMISEVTISFFFFFFTFIKLFVQLTVKLLKPTLWCGPQIAQLQSRNIHVNIVFNIIIYLPINKNAWPVVIATIKKLKENSNQLFRIIFMSDFKSLHKQRCHQMWYIFTFFLMFHIRDHVQLTPWNQFIWPVCTQEYRTWDHLICANIVCRICEQSVTSNNKYIPIILVWLLLPFWPIAKQRCDLSNQMLLESSN